MLILLQVYTLKSVRNLFNYETINESEEFYEHVWQTI